MVVINTQEKEHSWFSPSKAGANLACPGRLNACNGLPRKTSKEADRGTDCHTYMESLFNDNINSELAMSAFVEPWQAQAVLDAQEQLTDYMSGLMAIHGDPVMFQEVVLELPEDPTVFGTLDLLLWFPLTGHRANVDYKFGIGEVSVKNNGQLMTYGVMKPKNEKIAAFSQITIDSVIIQPRVYKEAQVCTHTSEELEAWKQLVLLPGIEAAKDPNAPRIPGEVACKYCDYDRQVGCAEAKNAAIQYAGSLMGIDNLLAIPPIEGTPKKVLAQLEEMQVQNPQTVDSSLLAAFLDRIKFIKTVIDNAEAAAVHRLMAGEIIPGYKAVNAVTRPTWIDEEKADAYLVRCKVKEDQRYKKTLITPRQAEDLIGAKEFEGRKRTAFSALWHYPVGGPDYAKIDDKRPAYAPPPPPAPVKEEPVEAPPAEIDLSSLF